MKFNVTKSIVFICLLAMLNACGIGRYHYLHLVKGDDIALKEKGKIHKKLIAKSEEISLNKSIDLKLIVTKIDSLNNEVLADNNTLKLSFLKNKFAIKSNHNFKEKVTSLTSKKQITHKKHLPTFGAKSAGINWLFLVLSIVLFLVLCAYLYFAIPFIIYWGVIGLIAAVPAILILLLFIKTIKLI